MVLTFSNFSRFVVAKQQFPDAVRFQCEQMVDLGAEVDGPQSVLSHQLGPLLRRVFQLPCQLLRSVVQISVTEHLVARAGQHVSELMASLRELIDLSTVDPERPALLNERNFTQASEDMFGLNLMP